MSLEELDDIFDEMDKIDEERVQIKEKVSDNMQQWEFELSMFKGKNSVGVNVRNINPDEYQEVRKLALREIKKAWNTLPSDDFKQIEVKTEEEYIEVVEKTYTNEEVKVVNADLVKLMVNSAGIPQAKGKQYDIIRQGINKGVFTLKDAKAVKHFEDTNKLIQQVFSAGVYDSKDVE